VIVQVKITPTQNREPEQDGVWGKVFQYPGLTWL